MNLSRGPVTGLTAMLLLSACVGGGGGLDWDLRGGAGFDTSDAARAATNPRPNADSRGVISYPGYQVAVARRGDTVATVAGRIGMDAAELARYNALRPSDALRDGEVLALPGRVAGGAAPAAPGGAVTGGVIGSGTPPSASGGAIDVTTIAGNAIDRAGSTTPAPAAPKPSPTPFQ